MNETVLYPGGRVLTMMVGAGHTNIEAASALIVRDARGVACSSDADLQIVDRDTLSCPLEDLASTRVLRTVLGGETVHDAGAL